MKKFHLVALVILFSAVALPVFVRADDSIQPVTVTPEAGSSGSATVQPATGNAAANTAPLQTTSGQPLVPSASSNTNGTFVPLSNIPDLTQNVTSGSSLPTFLNGLYTICIGIAVVIAVLQLVRAGITYMLVDSVTTKEQARHSITAAILGLLLVLSPYIVFSIINPGILNLNIGADVTNLQNGINAAPGSPQNATPAPVNPTPGSQPYGSACTNNLGQAGTFNGIACVGS